MQFPPISRPCGETIGRHGNPFSKCGINGCGLPRQFANRLAMTAEKEQVPGSPSSQRASCKHGRAMLAPTEARLRADMESVHTEENNTLVLWNQGVLIFRRILGRGRFSAFPQGMLGQHHSKDWQDTHRYAPRRRRSYRSFREGSRYPHPS